MHKVSPPAANIVSTPHVSHVQRKEGGEAFVSRLACSQVGKLMPGGRPA